jgi:hypothetical protein
MTPLHKITIEQIEKAADEYCDKYSPQLQTAVFHAFIDAVIWAVKVSEGKVELNGK